MDLPIPEKRIQELNDLAAYLAVNAVRNNTELENLHSGIFPESKAGEYSDVKVVASHSEIPWNQLSRISDSEMRTLMLSVEKAMKISLLAYESLNDEEKKGALEFFKTQRSYDCLNPI